MTEFRSKPPQSAPPFAPPFDDPFRIFFDQNPAVLMLINSEGKISLVNPKVREVFQYEPAELLGASVEILVPEASRAAHPHRRKDFEEQPDNRSMGAGRDLHGRRKDGTLVPVEISLTQVSMPEGPSILVTLIDISERKRAERMRDEFLMAASHELRTPLTPLKLYLQLLRKTASQNNKFEKLLNALDGAERSLLGLEWVVEDLIDVSSIAAGVFKLDRAPMDLSELLRELKGRFDPSLLAAGCELQLEGLSSAIPGVWDRGRLSKALTHLLKNAMRHGAGNPIRISAEVDPNKTARLIIQDHGEGIAPEDHARLFQPFSRLSPIMNFGGLGIGLYIVREVARAHGGSVTVESGLKRGSSFTLELPN